ncbi:MULTISPECIES: hypothetical protein [Butyricimonas]|uniref:hypothetical protein n=1 Tax=Butyricimonas TaxID=574697 RepID=UPI0011DCDBA3|nr:MULTISPECIES: hypothetical protein [Butyricimonas]
MRTLKFLFCVILFVNIMPELQAQVLEKEESVFGYISYGLKGDSLRWYSPGVFTFEIDSVEERKISEEIVREVIPDTLKTILLKKFQEKKRSDVGIAREVVPDTLSFKRRLIERLERETSLSIDLYFNPEGKILKAEIKFNKALETCIKEQDVNAMYRKIMKMKIDMGKLKNIASEPGQQPVFATWLIPVRKVLSL